MWGRASFGFFFRLVSDAVSIVGLSECESGNPCLAALWGCSELVDETSVAVERTGLSVPASSSGEGVSFFVRADLGPLEHQRLMCTPRPCLLEKHFLQKLQIYLVSVSFLSAWALVEERDIRA